MAVDTPGHGDADLPSASYGRLENYVINEDILAIEDYKRKNAGFDFGACFGPDGETLLHAAAETSVEMVNVIAPLMKDVNAKIAETGDTALHLAIHTHDYDVLKALIAHGADPDTANASGVTARMVAQNYGMVDVVRMFDGDCAPEVPSPPRAPSVTADALPSAALSMSGRFRLRMKR